jgi:deoxyadenosine/deoxycytidine kinase
MKKLATIILLFLLATACGRKEKGFMPERLLTEQEMIDVLTDVQIIEADINYQKNQERDHKEEDSVKTAPKDYFKMSREYYDQLFEHYGITDSIFVQNLRYYTEQPEMLERIMDSVTNRLAKEKS